MNCKHLWFDFSDTIATMDKAQFDEMMHSFYSEVVGKPVTDELKAEYKALFAQHKSNASIFVALGKPADYISTKIPNRESLLTLTDPHIPEVLQKLRAILPISIFSNSRLDTVLVPLGISPEWFTHVLGPDRIRKPKPALDGFYQMVELSKVEAGEILFVGDSWEKDLAPAKEVGIQTGILWSTSDNANYCFRDFSDILKLFES